MNNMLLYLTCKNCKILYEKPLSFKELAEGNTPSAFFFKNCINYCDKCRIDKEKELLNYLPDVIKLLNKK